MAADLDGAAARVGMWLRSTVPGDLARAVGETYTVRTDDVAAVLDALDAAQRSAATERAQREAAMRERCAVAAGDVATRAKALALHHGAQWNADGAVHAAAESTGATHAADAIRALPLEVPRG